LERERKEKKRRKKRKGEGKKKKKRKEEGIGPGRSSRHDSGRIDFTARSWISSFFNSVWKAKSSYLG
jgi:hypothetical protein